MSLKLTALTDDLCRREILCNIVDKLEKISMTLMCDIMTAYITGSSRCASVPGLVVLFFYFCHHIHVRSKMNHETEQLYRESKNCLILFLQ